MIPPTMNGWHVDPSRERVSDEIHRYLRSEFREDSAGWLLVKKESPR